MVVESAGMTVRQSTGAPWAQASAADSRNRSGPPSSRRHDPKATAVPPTFSEPPPTPTLAADPYTPPPDPRPPPAPNTPPPPPPAPPNAPTPPRPDTARIPLLRTAPPRAESPTDNAPATQAAAISP